VVAAARFNPNSKDGQGKAHLLQMRAGSAASSLPVGSPLAAWDPACEINDSLLAALIQLLSLEHEIEVDFVLAAGYRLPQEICLNLPSRPADATIESVKALYDGLVHCNAAAPLQVWLVVRVFSSPALPTLFERMCFLLVVFPLSWQRPAPI
jgi:hypothetical protein